MGIPHVYAPAKYHRSGSVRGSRTPKLKRKLDVKYTPVVLHRGGCRCSGTDAALQQLSVEDGGVTGHEKIHQHRRGG